MTTTLTRALPLLTPRWLRLWGRYLVLAVRYASDADLLGEWYGLTHGVLWHVRRTNGIVRDGYRVVTVPVRNPAVWMERVDWSDDAEVTAWAWVAAAADSPVLAFAASDDEGPWVQLRSMDADEVRAVLRSAGCEAETIERVVKGAGQ